MINKPWLRFAFPSLILVVLAIPTYFLWSIKHGYLAFLFLVYFVDLYIPKRSETKKISVIYTRRTFYTIAPLLFFLLVFRNYNLGQS